MSFLSPLALLGLLFLPVVVAMYLLKLRRDEQVVPSTLLWKRLLTDVEANAPWQKLRRSLLLRRVGTGQKLCRRLRVVRFAAVGERMLAIAFGMALRAARPIGVVVNRFLGLAGQRVIALPTVDRVLLRTAIVERHF